MQKQAVQFIKKPYLPLFLSETADKFARDYAIKKSFRHALHLVIAHLHRQNQVAHALRTRDFWLASLSIDFPIHFARRVHKYPVTLSSSSQDLCSRLLVVSCPDHTPRGERRLSPRGGVWSGHETRLLADTRTLHCETLGLLLMKLLFSMLLSLTGPTTVLQVFSVVMDTQSGVEHSLTMVQYSCAIHLIRL